MAVAGWSKAVSITSRHSISDTFEERVALCGKSTIYDPTISDLQGVLRGSFNATQTYVWPIMTILQHAHNILFKFQSIAPHDLSIMAQTHEFLFLYKL